MTSDAADAFDTVAGTWSAKAPMPTARWSSAAAVLNGKAYVIGGLANNTTMYSVVEVYDPATNTWSSAASMPLTRRLHTAAAVNGKVYVIGGVDDNFTFLTRLDAYDPASDSWSTLTPAPYARLRGAAVVLNGLIYVVGGELSSGHPSILVYDPATDTWSTKAAKFAAARNGLGAAVLNGEIYAAGGQINFAAVANVDKYDAVADAWIAVAPLPQARQDFAMVEADGALYALGGISGGTILSRVDKFAPAAPADAIAPITVAAVSPAANAAGWNNSAVNVTLTASDNTGGSGVKSITYSINGGAVTAVNGASASFALAAQGTHTVLYHATDDADNVEANKTLVVRIDTAAPSTAASASPTANPAGWNNAPVQVSLNATDSGGSGVQALSYVVTTGSSSTGTSVTGSTASFTLSAEGVHTVHYQALDNAGNQAASKALVVRIDKTAPNATLTLSPDVLWPPNHRMVTITPTLIVTDASGFTVSGPVVTSNEAADGSGDGDTVPDWLVSGSTLQLRAERAGPGSGRVYTVTYTITDLAGNTTQASARVAVPHNR